MKAAPFFAVWLALATSSCAFFNGEPILDEDFFLLHATIDGKTEKTPLNVTELPANCRSPDELTVLDDIAKCTEAMKTLIDLRWGQYEDELQGTVNITSTLTDIATLGVNAAGTLTGASTTRILSAVAGGITGSRASANSNLLLNHSVVIVLSQMRADRASWAATIATRETAGTKTAYTNMYQAANDLYAYDRAGSLSEALVSMQSSAGQQDAACSAELKNSKVGEATDLSTAAAKCAPKSALANDATTTSPRATDASVTPPSSAVLPAPAATSTSQPKAKATTTK